MAPFSPSTKVFAVGICASDTAGRLPALLSFLRSEAYGDGFGLEQVITVASGCPPATISAAREAAAGDARFEFILEDERQGKAEAINRIVERARGDYLVLLNADAVPDPGSIGETLRLAGTDSRIGCVSALPRLEEGRGILRDSLGLMWSAHSCLSLSLNHMGVSNHACDELLVLRRSLVPRLPDGLVNDGAYIGGFLRARGYHVRFTSSARVRIVVPARVTDLIRQRRRIIFGHIQVWRELGTPPKTVESLFFLSPATGIRMLARTLASRPRYVLVLPVVLVSELISATLSIRDVVSSTSMHAVWRRFA